MWQVALTGLIVGACAVYSAWVLAPAALRLRCLAALGRTPARAPVGGCGSGCNGCGDRAAPRGGPQVIRVIKRKTLA